MALPRGNIELLPERQQAQATLRWPHGRSTTGATGDSPSLERNIFREEEPMNDKRDLRRPVTPAASVASAASMSLSPTAMVTAMVRKKPTKSPNVKTSSERGKAFRARRKVYEHTLFDVVSSLRDEVRDLEILRDLRGETALVTRLSLDGSVARVIREYFALFAHGRPVRLHVGGKRESPSTVDSLVTKQLAFLANTMDDSLQFGRTVGRAALVEQWERYSRYHANFCMSVTNIEVSGSEEAPLVTVTPAMSVTLTRETFEHIFPHVADNEALVQRLIGKRVTYRAVNQFLFGADDHRVLVYDTDVDFINAFVEAGVSLADVATLMGQALIADQCFLGEEPFSLLPSKLSSPASTIEILADDDASPTAKRPCQTIEFLLN